ncbi:MAG: nucleotide pyrophosphohydrolase [Sphaerochaetaceae bacterium]|nr:nucleotide pyrophosphohydrolase [Spirochaetales bacterium]MDY5500855.1 nucleotide pyrophosphohydrolase [Sphaerochaetaceae bacterium]
MLDKEVEEKVRQFVHERDWEQFHTPKDLAISICLEAAELLEKFQWSGTDLVVEKKKGEMAEELADVMMYCLMMADTLGLDAKQIILDKLRQNERKYDIAHARGNAKKYTEF